jgi:hypothetical protein
MDDLTSIIATRRYCIEPPEGDLELIVSFERPVRDPSGYFRCAFHLTGDYEVTQLAAGVDEVNALIFALQMAGALLDYLNDSRYNGKLQWEGGSAKQSLPTICDHWPFNKQPGE